MWEYSYDGKNWEGGIGLADPGKGNGTVSIFDDVIPSEDGKSITFKWKGETGELLTKTVSLTTVLFKNRCTRRDKVWTW